MKQFKKVASIALSLMLVLGFFITSAPVETNAALTTVNYSGSKAYMDGKYGKALKNVILTTDVRSNIIAVAKSQVGYREGDSKAGFSGETKGTNNYTEFGRWNYEENGLGGQLNHYWCASFVSWVARRANVSTSNIPNSALAGGMKGASATKYTRADIVSGKYTPQPGDLIHYSSSHVGIIESYTSTKKMTTIEGNTGNDDGSRNGYFVKEKKDIALPSSCDYIINIGVASGPSKLKINMTKAPGTVTYGNPYNLEGTVSSNYKLTNVTGYIMKGDTVQQKAESNPEGNSLTIKTSNINKNLKFGQLKKGSYTLKIVAKDSKGAKKTYTKNFTVK